MKQTINHIRTQLWVLLLPAIIAVAAAFTAVQPAAAESPELVLKAPVQEVDINGDGETEPFSGYASTFTGGVRVGQINLGRTHSITLERGLPSCVDGVDTAVLQGTLYETTTAAPVEIDDVTIHVSPANGGSSGGGGNIDVDFDIINSAIQPYNFQAQATLFFENPPCAS